jgi:hypothetical protein
MHAPPPRSDAVQAIYPLSSTTPITDAQVSQVLATAQTQNLPTPACCERAKAFDAASCACDPVLPGSLKAVGVSATSVGLQSCERQYQPANCHPPSSPPRSLSFRPALALSTCPSRAAVASPPCPLLQPPSLRARPATSNPCPASRPRADSPSLSPLPARAPAPWRLPTHPTYTHIPHTPTSHTTVPHSFTAVQISCKHKKN